MKNRCSYAIVNLSDIIRNIWNKKRYSFMDGKKKTSHISSLKKAIGFAKTKPGSIVLWVITNGCYKGQWGVAYRPGVSACRGCTYKGCESFCMDCANYGIKWDEE